MKKTIILLCVFPLIAVAQSKPPAVQIRAEVLKQAVTNATPSQLNDLFRTNNLTYICSTINLATNITQIQKIEGKFDPVDLAKAREQLNNRPAFKAWKDQKIKRK